MSITKNVIYLTVCLSIIAKLSVSCNAQEINQIWMENYAAALEKAKAENKYLLLNFSGSDWCANCIRMEKEVFSQADFIAYASENLILIKADFPVRNANKQDAQLKKQNEALAEKFNSEGAFPSIIVFDENEKIIAHSGYRPGGALSFVEYLKSVLK